MTFVSHLCTCALPATIFISLSTKGMAIILYSLFFPQNHSTSRSKMFKKFEAKDVGNTNQMKSSVQRGVRTKLVERYPAIEEHMDVIMPKKAVVKLVKCHDHIELIEVDGEILFFQQRDDGPYPTLKLLHKYPHILPHQQAGFYFLHTP